MKKLLFLFLALTLSATLFAQKDTLPDVFLTPRAAIENHLLYLQEETFNDLQSAKSFAYTNTPRSVRARLALELKQILDGKGYYIELDEVPDDEDYFDSLSQEHKYILVDEFPQIYLQKYGRAWLYSQETVKSIEDLHESIFPFGTSKLLKDIRPNKENQIIGIYYWQLLFAAVMIVALFILYYVLLFVLKRLILGLFIRWFSLKVETSVLYPIARPISFALVFYTLFKALPLLQMSASASAFVTNLVSIAFVLAMTALFVRVTNATEFFGIKIAQRTDNTLDDHLVPLITKVMKGLVIIIGAIAMLNVLGVDLVPLLTGLSIGGLAFALAAQDTIKNFFGSLMIFLDKPFQIGDWITEGEIDGTVEEVGLRSTRIRTFRDSLMYVPNGEIANGRIDNHGERRYRRFYTSINITYDTPAKMIQLFLQGLRRIVEEHPDTRKDYYNIYLNDYMDSSLKIMFYVFFAVPTWPEELRCREEIMLEINQLAEHLGVRFAFPTQTLHVEELPGQLSLTPNYKDSKDAYQARLDQYFEEKKKK